MWHIRKPIAASNPLPWVRNKAKASGGCFYWASQPGWWRWLAGAGAWAVVLGCLPLAALIGLLADGYIVKVSAHGLRVTETALLIPTRIHHFPLDCVLEPYLTLDSDEAEGVAVRDASRPDSEICLGTGHSAHALRQALEEARARFAPPPD